MPTKTKNDTRSMTYVKIFILTFFLIVVVAIAFKLANLYIHRNYTSNSFTFLVLEKDAYIVRVDNAANTVSVARVKGITPKFYSASSRYQEVFLGVPFEGSIVYRDRPSESHFNKDFFAFPRLLELLLRRDKIFYRNINPVDVVKIYITAWFSKDMSTSVFDLKNFDASVFLTHHMDKKMSELFRDSVIFNEAVSIEVDNATSINGLGSLVAGMLKDVGYNVVFVTSEKTTAHTAIISRVEDTVTLEKLQHIFDVPIQRSTASAQTDVSIIVGDDFYK